MSSSRSARRMIGVTFMLILCLVGLGCRLFHLHLATSQSARDRVKRLRKSEREMIVARGRIYDSRAGDNILALNLILNDIIADPETIIETGNIEEVTYALAPVLDMDTAQLMARIDRPGRKFERIKRNVTDDVVRQVKEMRLPGISFRETTQRCYPQGPSMCHVVGFVNAEAVGSSGVEQVMNGKLRGCPGYRETILDGRRKEIYERRIQDIPPRAGADVFLTLDQNIQYAVEDALDEAMKKYNARGAWAVVQHVRTGKILAMASRPAYDPNDYRNSSEPQRLNRSIGMVYEPGSTMKALTIASVLEERLATPETVVDCENGSWLYRRRVLRDSHGYGKLSVADVLKKSSNIGTAKLSIMLGDERLDSYMRKFGIGSPTGIDLPGEERGILHPLSKWSAISSSRLGMGQGVAVTALQMLNVLCTIANDGVRMKPYTISRVVSSDGKVIRASRPTALNKPISSTTAAMMRALLSRTTERGGTGTRARVPGYTVAGKTGTAQKAVRGGYSETAYTASFVGILPAERPEIGIIVVLDEPQPIHVGGIVAAPAFSKIAEHAVRCLTILPPSEDTRIAMGAGSIE